MIAKFWAPKLLKILNYLVQAYYKLMSTKQHHLRLAAILNLSYGEKI